LSAANWSPGRSCGDIVHVATAQHPDAIASDDRIFVTPDAVIMLDGASVFGPTDVPAAVYAAQLGSNVRDALTENPAADLSDSLALAIERTANTLNLTTDAAPSSTVAIARVRPDEGIDVLTLGDTQVVTPQRIIRDDRLNRVAKDKRAAYQARLRAGHGYDDEHRALLRALQNEQRRYRNRPGGYWIAETDPKAARHALRVRLPITSTSWLILATDGAHRPLGHLGLDDWHRLARLDPAALSDLLERCDRWEAEADPDGRALPRAKRHDDKSLAVVTVCLDSRDA
jgi:hypothetical protein